MVRLCAIFGNCVAAVCESAIPKACWVFSASSQQQSCGRRSCAINSEDRRVIPAFVRQLRRGTEPRHDIVAEHQCSNKLAPARVRVFCHRERRGQDDAVGMHAAALGRAHAIVIERGRRSAVDERRRARRQLAAAYAHTMLSGLPPSSVSNSRTSRTPGAADPAHATASVSSARRLADCSAADGMSSRRVVTTCCASRPEIVTANLSIFIRARRSCPTGAPRSCSAAGPCRPR